MKRIKCTSAYWEAANSKINVVTDFEDSLSSFDIAPYTETLNGLYFIFQAFPKDIPRKVLEYQIMRRKTKVLELYLILDYEKLMESTDVENLNHVKEVFLKGCETYLKPLKGFRYVEFVENVREIIDL